MTEKNNAYLIIGGARSGKSRRAMQLAAAASASRTFIATAEGLDEEMRQRIRRHRDERDATWTTIDAPIELAAAIESAASKGGSIVVDCLTLWLSNLMHVDRDVVAATDALATAVSASPDPLFIVSNEVGLGIVPPGELAREFRDAHGRMNQEIARVCSQVDFMAAGIPLQLKSRPG